MLKFHSHFWFLSFFPPIPSDKIPAPVAWIPDFPWAKTGQSQFPFYPFRTLIIVANSNDFTAVWQIQLFFCKNKYKLNKLVHECVCPWKLVDPIRIKLAVFFPYQKEICFCVVIGGKKNENKLLKSLKGSTHNKGQTHKRLVKFSKKQILFWQKSL